MYKVYTLCDMLKIKEKSKNKAHVYTLASECAQTQQNKEKTIQTQALLHLY